MNKKVEAAKYNNSQVRHYQVLCKSLEASQADK